MTLSAAILVSLLVSLTTTPMLCARQHTKKSPAACSAPAENGLFESMLEGYRPFAGLGLAPRPLMMVVLAAIIALNIYLYIVVPKGFFPQQDTGRLNGNIRADQSISFQAMQQKLQRFIDLVGKDPAVELAVDFYRRR